MGLSTQSYISAAGLSPAENILAFAHAQGIPEPVSVASEPWLEPEPFGGRLPAVEPMLPEMLPASLRPMIEDIAARMQVPLDFPAVAAIATLAGVAGRRACIQPKERDTWRVVPNLWGGIVAEPGSMKSPVLSIITEPIKALEREWRTEHEAARQRYERGAEEAELAKANWKEITKQAMKNGKPSPSRPDDPPAAPSERRLLTQDATLQSLHVILAGNPAGIFVLRDELTGWFAQLEKAGREQERGFYLESWNGDSPYTIDTVTRGSVHVPHVCLSLFGGIQPARLRSHLAEALRDGPANDGLMQRFQLLIWPDPVKGSRVYVDRQPNVAASRQAEEIYRRIAEMDAENPTVFRFGAEAQELFKVWLPELENRSLAPETGEVMRAHLAKYRKLMPALALLFALAEGATETCSLAHAQLAAAWCDYLESHARRVYSAQASSEQAAVYTLGQRIAAGELGRQFTLRDLYRKHWCGLSTPEEAQPAVSALEELQWLRPLAVLESKKGRKTKAYVVNPYLEARHAES